MFSKGKGKGHWLTPVCLIILVAIVLAVVYAQGVPLRAGIAMIAMAILGGLLLVWFLFRAPLPWRTRWLGSLAFLAALTAVRFCLRVDGSVDGTSMLKLAWKWSPKKGDSIEALPESVSTAVSSTAVEHRDVLQFLGDDARSGVFEAFEFSTDLETAREMWRIPMGLGYGGMSVAGDRVLTQEQRGDEELLTCYDLGSGAFLWAHRNTVRFSETLGGDGPRSTPTVDLDAGRVYAMGTTGILDCVNLETGDLIWSKNVLAEAGGNLPTYGKPNAPLLVGDLVVVTGGDRAPTLLAYRKADGSAAWTAGESGCSYSSPALLDVNGVMQIVSVNSDNVTGHDPVGGAVQWTFPWKANWPKSSQPRSVGGGRILLTSSYGMGSHLIEVKGNVVDEIWSTIRMKTKFSSVCVRGDYAYGLDEGVFSCIEIETGDRVWKDGRYGFGQNILAGSVLIVLGERGEVILVDANGEEHRELGRRQVLEGKTWNTPTLAAPYLLVRNDTEAVCLLLKSP